MPGKSRFSRNNLAFPAWPRLLAALLIGSATAQAHAAQGTFTTLHSFQGDDGVYVPSGLAFGGDGQLYGTAYYGGYGYDPSATTTSGFGTAYKISTGGAFQQIFSFGATGQAGQTGLVGVFPTDALVLGPNGKFYGCTHTGLNGYGGVFELSPSGVMKSTYNFTGRYDGNGPNGSLVFGSDGNLYGTTTDGGVAIPHFVGYGAVFRLTTAGKLTPLHAFNQTDGSYPRAGLVLGSDGYFYGTTQAGGANDKGTIFKISPSGQFTKLHDFDGTDGWNILSGLVEGPDGYFYGDALYGGAYATADNSGGTIFKISSAGDFTLLQSFNLTDGANPSAALMVGLDGELYGTTMDGSEAGCSEAAPCDGTIFKISTDGVLTTLYSLASSGAEGIYPTGVLVQASDGSLYGTTSAGGVSSSAHSFGLGTIFKLTVP